jgi:hypothetical protein
MKVKILRIIARLNIGGRARNAVLLTKGLSHRTEGIGQRDPYETIFVCGEAGQDEGDMVYLAKEILSKGKMGFGIRIDKWFRDDLRKYSYDVLMDPKCARRGYFKKESIKKLLEDYFSGKANNGFRIWALLNLELWHRIFIEGEKP